MAQKRVGGKFVKEEAAEIREAAAKLSPEAVQATITKAQLETNATLSRVGEQTITAFRELETINKAIEVQKQEAERLHGVEAIALEVEEAERLRDDKKDEIDREIESYERDAADKKAQLDREHNEKVRLNTENQNRAVAQWRFEFETQKQNELAQWEEHKRRRLIDETIRTEALDRNAKEREAALAAKEKEFTDLKAKVEAFPEELRKEVGKAVGIAENSLKRDHKHEIELLTSRFNSEKTIADNTISSLKADLTNKDKVITDLQVRIAAAEEKVASIANKALETAGNVKALADVQTSAAIASSNGQKRA